MLRRMQLEGHGAGRVARDGVHVLHYGARAPQAAACKCFRYMALRDYIVGSEADLKVWWNMCMSCIMAPNQHVL